MKYVDGYVLPVRTRDLRAYAALARKAARVWLDHGALEVKECAAEDLTAPCGVPFPRLLKLKRGETAVFSYIVYRSRAHRDRVNAKVMQDPRLQKMVGKPMPFDMKRMTYGGFRTLVDA